MLRCAQDDKTMQCFEDGLQVTGYKLQVSSETCNL